MAAAFQPNAFQNNAFQTGVGASTGWTITNLGTAFTAASTSNPTVTITVPAGALIYVLSNETATTTGAGTVSDTVNGPYTLKASAELVSAGYGGLFIFPNSAALSSVTLTYTKQSSSDGAGVSVGYITGALAGVDPTDLVATPTSGTSTSPSVTSGTPAVANEFFLGFAAFVGASNTYSNNGSWTTPPNAQTGNAGGDLGGGSLVNSGTGAETFAPTLGTSQHWAAFLISFKPALTPIFNVDTTRILTGAVAQDRHSPTAFVPIPSTLPPQISGMAWQKTFEQPLPTKPFTPVLDHNFAPQAVGAPPVAGMAWHRPFEQPAPIRPRTELFPAKFVAFMAPAAVTISFIALGMDGGLSFESKNVSS